jgi:hypothetical protein
MKVNHLHKYKKVNLAGYGKPLYEVYQCQYPNCTHYIRLVLSEGKLCECNICGEPMIITKATLYGSNGGALVKPHCANCTKPSDKKKNVDKIADLIDSIKE